ncbi:uncharacterized protein LOC141602668 [Silene latifolia]|uniref:uncharacterized protein LOC141602668 n=1 Tax=Silene latifolia TaxID=37657 RepID=UPI003D784A4C
MSSSVLSSQSVIITTAMAVSGAVILLSLCRIKNLPSSIQQTSPSLRSCLSSERLKGENKNKKKKRVKFAENVKEDKSETNYANKKKKNKEEVKSRKVSKFREMPANQAALYHGILRDRVHRVESC